MATIEQPLRQTSSENLVTAPDSRVMAESPGLRPAQQYTPRVVPRHAQVQAPLEMSQIHWQR